MVTIHRILCPTDFSELSAHAITLAQSLGDALKADLYLLHIVDEGYQYWSVMGANGVPIGPPPEEMLEAARQGMANFVQTKYSRTGARMPAATEVRIGRPFLEIIRYAREISADLLVLGTHGRSGLSHVLLGSVTEKVVRKAPCPVLTVRHPEQSFSMP